MRRVIRVREHKDLSQSQVRQSIDDSLLYGVMGKSTYRCLEQRAESYAAERAQLVVSLVRAIAQALDVPVSEIATEDELACLPELGHRRNQWPPERSTGTPVRQSDSTPVPSPYLTQKRLRAYCLQAGYDNGRDFSESLARKASFEITQRVATNLLSQNPDSQNLRKLTYGFVRAAAIVLTPFGDTFSPRWLLECQPLCPHCNEWMINA
jgi:hypothetical protein